MSIESVKDYVQTLAHNKIVLYILIVLSVINIIGYYTMENSPAAILFLVTGLGLTYLTENMIYVLLSTILITSFFVSIGLKRHYGLR